MWVAGGRISLYDGENFRPFGLEEGLGQAVVHALWEDRQGQMWVGSVEGILRFDGRRFVPLAWRRAWTARFSASTRTAAASCGLAPTEV